MVAMVNLFLCDWKVIDLSCENSLFSRQGYKTTPSALMKQRVSFIVDTLKNIDKAEKRTMQKRIREYNVTPYRF